MRGLGPVLLLLAAVLCALWFLLGEGLSSDEPLDAGSLLGESLGGDALLTADEPVDEERAGGATALTAGAVRNVSDPGAGALELSGRVVDGRRHPIAQAVVTLARAGGRTRTATTDATGRYALSLPVRAGAGARRGVLVGRTESAATGGGRIGTAIVWLPPGSGAVLAPTLVLEAGAALSVRITRDGAPVPGAQVAVTRRLASVPVLLATSRADAGGRVLVPGLPLGAIEIFAAAPGSGRGHAKTLLPRPAGGPLEVVLGAERQVEVLVVDAATELPIAGAEVLAGDVLTMPDPFGPGYLPFAHSLHTDREGRARIVGVPVADVLYVNARASGYALTPWWQGGGHARREGAAGGAPAPRSEIRIALSRYRVVAFPVSAEGGAVPADDTALRVQITGAGRRTAGRALAAVMRAGALEVRGLPSRPVNGVVITPTGAQGLFQAPAGVEVGGVVRFSAVREVRVRVVDPEGGVLPDVALRLDPLGKGADVPPARTDAQGIAHFVDVGADVVAVRLVVADQPAAGIMLGRLDLKKEEEVYEVSLQRRVSFLVDVRIDGDARLPARYTLMVGNRRVGVADVEEDAASGRLRAWVRPPAASGRLEVSLHAHGYLPARASVAWSGEDEAQVSFELDAAGSLIAVVIPPKDGAYHLNLQRFDEADNAWQAVAPAGIGAGVQPSGFSSLQGKGGEQVFEGLAPGRYRVTDTRSGGVSAEALVEPGAAAPRVPLDLGGAVWLRGHVRAPAGTNLALARVLVEGRDEPGSIWSGARADTTGAFKVRARTGVALTLRVTHPTLSPARTGGRITVRPDAAGVQLTLEEAGRASFRLAGFEDAHTPANGAWYAPLRVLLFQGAAEQPVRVLQPTADEGLFSFGGFDPGTYRVLLVFGQKHAPLSLSKVALGSGLSELGTLTPSLGETLRIRWSTALPEGATIWATATHADQPAYVRRARHEKGTQELLCSGLGAGTFQLEVRGANLVPGSRLSSTVLDKRIVLDGKGETTIDVSWR